MTEPALSEQYQVVLTDKAARVIREAYEAEKADPERTYVRIGAMPGGCSGYKFQMDIADADQLGEADETFESNGIHVVVDRGCLTDVLGSVEVDFRDENMVEQGFSFRQLADSATCGCGQSFTAVKDAPKG